MISVESMVYHVNITTRAEKDLEHLYQWVTTQAPLRGPVWFEGLAHTIQSLEHHPGRCSVVLENDPSTDGIRQLLYGKKSHMYRILYQVIEREKEVRVLHIRYSARHSVTRQSLQRRFL